MLPLAGTASAGPGVKPAAARAGAAARDHNATMGTPRSPARLASLAVAAALIAASCTSRDCKAITCIEGVVVSAVLPGPAVDTAFEATVCSNTGCSTTTSGGAGVPIQSIVGGTAPVGESAPGDHVGVTLTVVSLPERVVVLRTSGTATLRLVDGGGCDDRTCVEGSLRYDGQQLVDDTPAR
jgi:hypothetical protein